MLAASGGLDSCTITHWLQSQGLEVIAYTADLGQPDEEHIEDIRSRMQACGAAEMILDDRREAICQAGIQLVQAQARYEGGYWNTTGIARHVTVAGMLPHMRERGIQVMAHGATGRGNDQVRFQLAAQMLAPHIEVYAPLARPGLLAKLWRAQRNDRLLPRAWPAHNRHPRQALLHRRQHARADARGWPA